MTGAPGQSTHNAKIQANYQSIRDLLLQTLSQGKTLWRAFAVQPHRRKDAQTVIDFLSQALLNDTSIQAEEAKQILSLIRTISKSANIFPAGYELFGVECDLNYPLKEGGCASICKGIYKNHSVCVKANRITHNRRNSNLRVQAKELTLWTHLSHPNILQFYGLYVPNPNFPRTCIITRWMPEGDLRVYLSERPGLSLNTRKLFLLDVIAGLVYLHDRGIIHADLKATNILVSESAHAVITDFGISSIQSGFSTTDPSMKGTHKWTAPELALGKQQKPSEKSDIWSYGCLGLEVLTNQTPYQRYQLPFGIFAALHGGESPMDKLDQEALQLILDSGLQSLLEKCCSFTSSSRPMSRSILHDLQRMGIWDTRQPNVSEDLLLRDIQTARSLVKVDHESVIGILQGLLGLPNSTSSEHSFRRNIPSELMGAIAHTVSNTPISSSISSRPSVIPPPLPTPHNNPFLASASASDARSHYFGASDTTTSHRDTPNEPWDPTFLSANSSPGFSASPGPHNSDTHYERYGISYQGQTQWPLYYTPTLPTSHLSANQLPYHNWNPHDTTNISLPSPSMPVPSHLPENWWEQRRIPYVDHNMTAQSCDPAEPSSLYFPGGFSVDAYRGGRR